MFTLLSMKLCALGLVLLVGCASDDRLSISDYLDRLAARSSVYEEGPACTLALSSNTQDVEWTLAIRWIDPNTQTEPSAGDATLVHGIWNHDTQDGPNGTTYHGHPVYDPREFDRNFEDSNSANPSLDARKGTRADFIECE